MSYYAGLDISLKTTSIAIVDQTGKIAFESVCETDPDVIALTIAESKITPEVAGIEAGSLSFWLVDALRSLGLNVKCIDSRKMAMLLSVTINKTDRNDARAIADAMRCNYYKEVHLKSKESISISVQMGIRRNLINTRTQLKNSIRGFLKASGIPLKAPALQKFSTAVRESIEFCPSSIKNPIESLLNVFEFTCGQINQLEKETEKLCKADPVINLFESIPGVGPITALAFKSTIDDPNRFKNARDIGAYLGLTPKQYSSGEISRQGRISKCGSSELRSLLVECGLVILTKIKVWTKLRAWGLKIQKRSGIRKACAAIARKLAIIMLRMWQKGETFIFGASENEKADRMAQSVG